MQTLIEINYYIESQQVKQINRLQSWKSSSITGSEEFPGVRKKKKLQMTTKISDSMLVPFTDSRNTKYWPYSLLFSSSRVTVKFLSDLVSYLNLVKGEIRLEEIS